MQVKAGGIEFALTEWAQVLGSSGVIADPSNLRSYSSATFSTHQKIPAILKPESVEQIQRCLKIATKFKVPVYPISTGKNWGYGSRVPASDNCVVMDLGGMRLITNFNESLGYVTIEPGVTQAQLYAFLKSRKSKLWMDATGSSPHCSIIGNTLERGFGHTPYGDHVAHACNFEVILPNGEVLQTGHPGSLGSAAAPVYKYGLGPSLEGLFAQSNLGVVSKMTLWLMPAPEYFEAFFFSCDHNKDLGSIIEALTPLRLNGTLRSTVHLGNDYKILAGIQQYPWDEAGGVTPLKPDVMGKLRKKLGFGAWSGSGGLYGSRAQVAEARRLVKQALHGRTRKLHFLNETFLNSAERHGELFRFLTRIDLKRTLSLVRPVFELMRGVPTEQSLRSAYWRKRSRPPATMDPDADLCGLQWVAPVAPAEAAHAERIASIACSNLLAHGFEPALSFTLLTDRALVCVISITYDRAIAGEDDRADQCFRKLNSALDEAGYTPYRLGIQSMPLTGPNQTASELMQALKRHVDPAHILAPGRYEAWGAMPSSSD